MLQAELNETFTSIQGEGLEVGARHFFVRLAGCNLACSYCDTDHKVREWLDSATLLEQLVSFLPVQAVSLTGGEPLLQVAFLKEFLTGVKERGVATYLETNGTLASALTKLTGLVDTVAVDIKLPTVCTIAPQWDAHEMFLNVCAAQGITTVCKIIVSYALVAEELQKALRLIKQCTPQATVILQPVHAQLDAELIRDMMQWQKMFLNEGLACRVVPQVHKFMNVK